MKKQRLWFIILTMLVNPCGWAGTLNLAIKGIEDLGPNAQYEGWLLVGGELTSTGAFSVNADGVLSQTAFPVQDDLIEMASHFVLSIEAIPDVSPEPSDSRYMAGDIVAGVAELAIGHEAAIGDDMSEASGVLALFSPTGGKGSPFSNGLWYQNILGPGLDLPVLPIGWRYEGWVLDLQANEALSTGTFVDPDGVDSDGAGPLAGLGPFPPYPGQDYVQEPRDLSDMHVAVISVEPVPDNAPTPFTLKPLIHGIEGHPGIQAMSNQALLTNPTGQVQLVLGGGVVSPQPVPSLGVIGWLAMVVAFLFCADRIRPMA